MPSSATPPPPAVGVGSTTRPEDLTLLLTASGSGDGLVVLKALRDVKNQIIGNKTKKLVYLQLGAVPKIVAILESAVDMGFPCAGQMVVQAAAALGSFACGVDDGVRAVLDSGAVPLLTRILSSSDEKIVDAGARSLRLIFQSKLAPKYDVLQEKNIKFLLSLLNSENENVTELAASIITHSCETVMEQKLLSDSGVLQRLIHLLDGSLNQRDASLDSIAAIVKNNSEMVSKFVNIDDGKALKYIIQLMKDRHPRTRLLACTCIMAIGRISPCYVRETEIITKLIVILIELLEEPGPVGDEAPFALLSLIAGKEELQKQAMSIDAVEKLCNFLHECPHEIKRLEGILLALAELCSMLEKSRCQLLSLKAFNVVVGSLKHEFANVRIAACTCLKNLSRSVKNLSAGRFDSQSIVVPLIGLLNDSSTSVQIAALGVICNIVVSFTIRKSVFLECGGAKELGRLSKSMDPVVRLNVVQALRNLMFHADRAQKEMLLPDIIESGLSALTCDFEVSVQEQVLALVCNLIDGCDDSVEKVLKKGVIDAVCRQLCHSTSTEACIQGMLIFCNIASGTEFHKEAVLSYILQPHQDGLPLINKSLLSENGLLRTASIWCILNLVSDSPTASVRVSKLYDAGVVSQIRNMIEDSCLDVKHRVKTALREIQLRNSPLHTV